MWRANRESVSTFDLASWPTVESIDDPSTLHWPTSMFEPVFESWASVLAWVLHTTRSGELSSTRVQVQNAASNACRTERCANECTHRRGNPRRTYAFRGGVLMQEHTTTRRKPSPAARTT